MSRSTDATRPTESLRYERDLIRSVVEEGTVRPEVAASMGHRAEQIDAELANRTAA